MKTNLEAFHRGAGVWVTCDRAHSTCLTRQVLTSGHTCEPSLQSAVDASLTPFTVPLGMPPARPTPPRQPWICFLSRQLNSMF